MNDLNRILVVSMCTRHCLNAVQWGVSLAKTHDAKLYVVHIMNNPFGLEGWSLPLSSIQTMKEEYDKMSQKAKETLSHYIESENTNGLSIEEQVIEGIPGEVISKFIEDNQIDLLIMTAHEQEQVEHMISGHDIRELVRKMPCSIFLARRELEFKKFKS